MTARTETLSRRHALLAGGAAALGAAKLAPGAMAQDATPMSGAVMDGLTAEIAEASKGLPGQLGYLFWAPEDAGRPEWSAGKSENDEFFIASVFKALALAETLRQLEAAIDPASDMPVSSQLNMGLSQQLPLDESVFSIAAPVLNSPNLRGQVTLRTAAEAMIAHSDNTGTDIVLKFATPEKVTAFIEEIGLTQTRIPLSTHQFFGYILGVEDWEGITWDQIENPDESLTPRPILNDTITMASTPAEMVSFYSRALTGEFFQYAETLEVFRNILALGDAVLRSMPLGANGFGKGGSIDFEGSHVLTFAGGFYVPDRWVYFAFFLNWTDAEGGTSGDVTPAYLAACKAIFVLLRDRLTRV
ncbi:MAG: serine hydrolase [Thermomicrobiales bacterium]